MTDKNEKISGEFKHVSVLLQETVDSLNVKPDGIYVDGTLVAVDMLLKYVNI